MKYLSIRLVLEHKRIDGATNLVRLMQREGQPAPAVRTLYKWMQRGTIPSAYAGAILWTCARQGIDPLVELLEEVEA